MPPFAEETGVLVGRRVVVGDDDQGIRTVLASWLPAQDLQVVGIAADGQQVVDLVESEKPDLVVLDLNMPRLSGLDALPRIRQLCPDTKVIVLSAELVPIVCSAVAALGATPVDKAAGLGALLEAIQAGDS